MRPIEPIDSDQLATMEIFKNLAADADAFEEYQNPHASRVAAIAEQIGKAFNLGTRDRFSLRVAALGHDIGEAAMAREYIQRNRPLSDDERIHIARHPSLRF